MEDVNYFLLCLLPKAFLTTPSLFQPYPVQTYLCISSHSSGPLLITLALWYILQADRTIPLIYSSFAKFSYLLGMLKYQIRFFVPCTNSIRLSEDTILSYLIGWNCRTGPSQMRLGKRRFATSNSV